MKRMITKGFERWGICLCIFAACAGVTAPVATGTAPDPATDALYEGKVQEARKCDPMYCPEQDRNRDKAVELYEAALSLRPGDVRNIEVEHRIAQL